MRDYLLQYAKVPVTVVYNGISDEMIGMDVSSPLNREESDEKTILYAGNLGLVQQLDLLIQGFAELSEQRELDALPGKIEALESEIGELHAAMGNPEFYQQSGDEIAAAQERLKNWEAELEAAFERWQELE